MARFFLQNFGCRANQADGAALAAALRRAGLEQAPAPAAADWVVLNTCTVTAAADAEARRALRRLRRRHPGARFAVTGCYAQRAPEEVAALPGVEVVAGHAEKFTLASRLLPAAALVPAPKLASGALLERARPVLKVQEGCSRRCAYCVIPQVRGPSRSVPLGVVLAEAAALAAAGVQEAVLSGINLGEWGRDLGAGVRLAILVRALLEQTALPRLRLSSVEPADWSPELTACMAAAPRLCRHAHLPLQSGCDAVLRRMRRPYRAADFAARVLELHRQVPGIAIGTDLIVGFPGETGAEFDQTHALVAQLPLAYLHVFTYSPRAGTEAAARLASGVWPAVAPQAAASRAAALRRLGHEKHASFLRELVGARLRVVTLHDQHAGGSWSLSDNYARVVLPENLPAGRQLTATITAAAGDHVRGERVAA